MRTLDHVKPHKRKRIATETMEIYAPLAGRMGMQDLREELEELSFKYINPTAYETVTQHLKELAEKNRNLTTRISKDLTQRLADEKIEARVAGRQKKAFSVFRKMESKALSFEQLSDIYGFRVIVGTVEECYRTLGIVHTNWPMVPNRFKDFISTPKQNDYRSIHTTVIGPSRQRVELQIRTEAMHRLAEYGVAAHAAYKEGEGEASPSLSESRAYATLRKTIEQLAEGDNSEEFLEHTKLELFLDQVFCFTPKGRIIALPKGATPIDFAYAVHTDIGNSCVGCKLNGKIMPVITQLQNGDEVEIIRSDAQTPPSAWESVVVTGKARSAIRRASRQSIRAQYAGLGSRILERAFERAGKTFSPDVLEIALPRLARENMDDALADVGRGEILAADVIRAAFPEFEDEESKKKPKSSERWFRFRPSRGLNFPLPLSRSRARSKKPDKAKAIPIRGITGDLPVRFAPETGAVPGDRIVGILEPGVGITIYPIQSPALEAFDNEPERWIDVRWDVEEEGTERFPAKIKVLASNEPGSLAAITEVIATNDGNIHNLVMDVPVDDFTELKIELNVWDLRHLERIIKQIGKKPQVTRAERITG